MRRGECHTFLLVVEKDSPEKQWNARDEDGTKQQRDPQIPVNNQ